MTDVFIKRRNLNIDMPMRRRPREDEGRDGAMFLPAKEC